MSKTTFIDQLGDRLPLLAKVVRKGFDAPITHYSQLGDVHTKRTQSSLRHDHMIRAALEILPTPEFHPILSRQRSLFSYKDRFLIQFKKLKPNLTTYNIQTRQAELFDLFGVVDGLLGIGASIPLLSAGYVASPHFGLEGIFLTRIVNHEPAWVHRLDDEGEEAPPITSILYPNDPNAPTGSPSRIRRPATGDTSTGTHQSKP